MPRVRTLRSSLTLSPIASIPRSFSLSCDSGSMLLVLCRHKRRSVRSRWLGVYKHGGAGHVEQQLTMRRLPQEQGLALRRLHGQHTEGNIGTCWSLPAFLKFQQATRKHDFSQTIKQIPGWLHHMLVSCPCNRGSQNNPLDSIQKHTRQVQRLLADRLQLGGA